MKFRTAIEIGMAGAGIVGGLLGVKTYVDQQDINKALLAEGQKTQQRLQVTENELCKGENLLLVHDFVLRNIVGIPSQEPVLRDCDTNAPLYPDTPPKPSGKTD